MTLEELTTSLDLSKKLKEIGFPQETAFYWANIYSTNLEAGSKGRKWWLISGPLSKAEKAQERECQVLAAPLAEEVGRWLPRDIKINGRELSLTVEKYNKYEYFCSYSDDSYCGEIASQERKLSESLAEMLLHLHFQGLVDFKEKNNV